MKRKSFIYINLLIVLLLTACEDVVDVDLDTGDPQLVIDAEIVWQKGTNGNNQTIKISRMTDYYNTSIPKVSGAQVHIENSHGDSFDFMETDIPGSYSCNDFIPEINETYTLFVTVEGQSFTASETLISVTKINQVTQEVVTDFSGEDEIEVTFSFNDPAEETNYYLADYRSDFLIYPEYSLTDDELFNGNEIRDRFSDEEMEPGDTLSITNRGISQQFHNYMDLILDASSANPFTAPPANIRGNIVNQNDPSHFALGYFRLCETDHKSYIVQ